MTPLPRLLLVGCGKMGGALLQRLAAQFTTCVVEPSAPPAYVQSLPRVAWMASIDALAPAFQPDIIILAVKPQQMVAALPAYARFKTSVFLSIAAGMTLAVLEKFIQNPGASIVRSMPNLPASLGMGMSVAVANKNVSADQHALCEQCLKAVGEMAWVEDEKYLDAATALSGNGPAYVFALCEAMGKAGEALGLSPTLAAKLARQTIIGSGALLAQAPESAEALRKAVTSPGGTTEAALKKLLAQDGLHDVMLKAMTAAVERSKELARSA